MTELIIRLSDDDPDVRLAALMEAGELQDVQGHDAVVEAVVRRLWDEHPGIRQASLDMLGRLSAFAGYVAIDRVVARALELTEDERTGVRAEAAGSLALLSVSIQGPERVQRLMALCQDPEADVRGHALAALGDLKAPQSVEAIASCLHDPDAQVAFEAAFALASVKDERARPSLEALLTRSKRRLDACEALRRLGSAEAVPALRAQSKKWWLPWGDRLTVWATLHSLGAEEAGAEVLARTKARRFEERTYALSLIGSHRIPAGRSTLEAVALDSKDPLQDTAVRALGGLGLAESAGLLATLAADPQASIELRADAVTALLACSPEEAAAYAECDEPALRRAYQRAQQTA